jgi:hypothetical protein
MPVIVMHVRCVSVFVFEPAMHMNMRVRLP